MRSIVVDMFEVQLGSAMYLEFHLHGQTVRILADAGIKASGYPNEHVRDKLRDRLGDETRLDLIIGTHYDEDHLNGLVPIIENPKIDIGEAWLPPVANDARQVAADSTVSSHQLLSEQFTRDNSVSVLQHYLSKKHQEIEFIISIERQLRQDTDSSFKMSPADFEREVPQIEYFRRHLAQPDADDIEHGHGADESLPPVVETMIERLQIGLFSWRPDLEGAFLAALASRKSNPSQVAARMATLGHIKRSVAKDAINAVALHEVVRALVHRKVPMRFEVIDDGTPQRYAWHTGKRRFLPSRPDAEGLTLDLLGPSRSLVKKHRDRLPVMEAATIALAYAGELKSITPSNQLSYVCCFRHNGQAILVTGDAGCVDFTERRGVYYPKLLAALRILHVIQVAHHGGNNAHFYRVLAAAEYPEQVERSYLLLSHATDDRFRPSDEFRTFLMTTRTIGDDVTLLFTSRPKLEKVADYVEAIHPVEGRGGDVGDVRLEFDGNWKVISHAVDVR